MASSQYGRNAGRRESLLPKLQKTPERKNNDGSSKKISPNFNSQLPQLNRSRKKKRQQQLVKKKSVRRQNLQKFHTEAMIEDSFISISNTNKEPRLSFKDTEEIVDDTLLDFRRKIQQNRIYIKRQILKKNKQNNSKQRKHSYMMYSSKKLVPTNSSVHNVIAQKRSSYKPIKQVTKQKNNLSLYNNLQLILQDRLIISNQSSYQSTEKTKLAQILYKLNKMKSQKIINNNVFEKQFKSAENLKRQTNYKDWHKVKITDNSKLSYRKSSFEEQMNKVADYTERNDASLDKYLKNKQQMLKMGLKF